MSDACASRRSRAAPYAARLASILVLLSGGPPGTAQEGEDVETARSPAGAIELPAI